MALYVVPMAIEILISPVKKKAVIMLTTMQIILQIIDLTIDLFLESDIQLKPRIC